MRSGGGGRFGLGLLLIVLPPSENGTETGKLTGVGSGRERHRGRNGKEETTTGRTSGRVHQTRGMSCETSKDTATSRSLSVLHRYCYVILISQDPPGNRRGGKSPEKPEESGMKLSHYSFSKNAGEEQEGRDRHKERSYEKRGIQEGSVPPSRYLLC